MREAKTLLAILVSTAASVHGLVFTPESDCQAYCSNGGTDPAKTNASDIVCKDKDFTESGNGIQFKNCVSCLQDSDVVSGSDTDVHAFLYNTRYALNVCLYSYPEKPTGQTASAVCGLDGACKNLGNALKTALDDPTSENAYDYCDEINNFEDDKSYEGCLSCIKSSTDQHYLANFLVALKAGCEQRPEDGDVISVSDDVFNGSLVEIVEPAEDITERPEGAGSDTMTTGAIVGIAVGCGLLFLGAGVLIFHYYRRQRRNPREKLESPPPDSPGGPKFISSSNKDAFSSKHEMSESITSVNGRPKPGHLRSYSTNSAYHDTLKADNENQGLGLSNHYAPQPQQSVPLGALPAHPAYIPSVMSRGPERGPPGPGAPQNQPAESYALRTYVNAPEPSNPVNPADPGRNIFVHHARSYSQPIRQPSPPRPAAMPGVPGIPPPPPPPPKNKIKVPSLVLPSLSKAKASKTYKPPQITVTKPAEEGQGLSISKPLAVTEPRFNDLPLGGGQGPATQATASFPQLNKDDSPMMSDRSSIVYG